MLDTPHSHPKPLEKRHVLAQGVSPGCSADHPCATSTNLITVCATYAAINPTTQAITNHLCRVSIKSANTPDTNTNKKGTAPNKNPAPPACGFAIPRTTNSTPTSNGAVFPKYRVRPQAAYVTTATGTNNANAGHALPICTATCLYTPASANPRQVAPQKIA